MRWFGLWVCVVAATGCQGWGERLTGGGVPDGGALGTDAAPPPLRSGDPPGDGGPAACAPSPVDDAGVSLAPPPVAAWGPPTAVPFSCDPLPGTFLFPRPTSDTPGAYARCASFADARATALAVSRDGTRVALIGTDGIARIVDVATHTVVGVLAPPRASVGLAAFSPDGATIVTVQKGERTVIRWSTDTFAPVWTTNLPGHSYFGTWQGAAAFSPDGATLLVSPGADLFVMDPETGAILNSRQSSSVLGAGYALNGRRVVVQEAPITGMCAQGPAGGSVTVLETYSLTPIATPMVWPVTNDEGPPPGKMLVAAGADLVLTSGPEGDPNPQAFRVSDGSPLPKPEIGAFPLALTPDGTAAVAAAGGQLQLQRISDGAVIGSVVAAAPSALGISGDGTTIAFGSSGANLLDVWLPATGVLAPTCSAELRPAGRSDLGPVVSADGQTVAIPWGTQVRLLHRADGMAISTIDGGTSQVWSTSLSNDAAYAIVQFSWPGTGYLTNLFRTSDGAQVASLGTGWSYVFFKNTDTVLDGLKSGGDSILYTHPDGGQWHPDLQFSEAVTAAGMSGDCPVMVSPRNNMAWRACGACSDPPFTTSTTGGFLSQDGTAFLGQDPGQVAGATLWQVHAQGDAIQTYPPRPEESTWNPSEFPIAVSAHGDRVMTGAKQFASCGYSPGFTSRIHDVPSNTVVDELPPNATSASADLNVVAIGAVLWCTR
jgi:hypothetical protein